MRKVTMYSGDPCPYCNAAKALLKSKNVEIEEFDISKDSTKAKEMLQRTNGARTIPQIFIGTHYVGGNDQLQEANRSGKLDELLKD
jgi:glutaredoxin 3